MSMPPTDAGSSPPAAGPYAGHPRVQPGDPSYAQPAPPSNRRTVGWIGVAALYALVTWQLLVPTVTTLARSTRSGSPISADSPVGMQNWADVMPQLLPALGFSIGAVLPVTVVAAALGLVVATAMTPQHPLSRPVRVVVGVLAALFVPLGIGLSRFLSADGMGSPAQARTFVLVSVTLAALPLLTAGFATAFAVALATRAPGRGVAAVLLVGGAGALALGPQLFEIPVVFTGGGPQDVTQTPMTLIYRLGFTMFDLGRGSAVAGAVLLLAGLLGIGAVLALLLLRVRLGVQEGGEPAPVRSGLGVVGAVVAVVVLLGSAVVLLPVLAGGFSAVPDGQVSAVQVAISTWAPVAIGTIAQVAVALLGGAAIGWCRPAGRHSLLLLLPLAPWLFVGPGPLMLARYLQRRDSGTLDTWLGLIPGPTVVVGAVVLMALLFAGLRERHRRPRVIGAAAAATAGVLLVVQAQSLLPSLMVISGGDGLTAPLTLVRFVGAMGVKGDAGWLMGLLYPLPMLLVVAALGALGQLGLRRVVLQAPQQPELPVYRS